MPTFIQPDVALRFGNYQFHPLIVVEPTPAKPKKGCKRGTTSSPTKVTSPSFYMVPVVPVLTVRRDPFLLDGMCKDKNGERALRFKPNLLPGFFK